MAAGSGSAPLVAVVEPSDLRKLHDLPDGRRLGRPGGGRVLAEAEVASSSVIVGEVLSDDAVKVPGVEYHYVIEAVVRQNPIRMKTVDVLAPPGETQRQCLISPSLF